MSNTRLKRGDSFRPKLIALSVAACFSLSATQTSANPTGGKVASGSASFSASGNTLTITNTAGTIINWQSFSIGVNEITRFLQSSSSSTVLNRVVGKNGVVPQSVIDGVLTSNGRVFLLNSSGILIGKGARIDVAGLVASSLNLSNQDFRAGKMHFTETPGAGIVSNEGVIDTTSSGPGGRVFLIARDVKNSGIIRTPQGQIVLAAGKSVDLVSENSPFVTVTITADTERALNLGKLIADSGRIGMFGGLVRQGGVAQANSAVVGANGEIRLVATKDLTLDDGSLTTANGPSGGNILLQAESGTNLVSGTVEAQGNSGQGGTIQALGVRVGVVGHGVIDASGDAGGGTVLVGGDYQGANPNVQNAQQTLVGPDGIIRADARTTGDGGRVIVWSDSDTRFYGSISAQGGAQSGNGGFVETSGKTLQAFGSVDTGAPNGKGGNWLLDPDFIEIVATTNSPALLNCATILTPAICFDDAPVNGTSQVTLAALDGALRPANGSVTLQAHKDITLLTDLTLPAVGGGRNFTAQAGNNINLHGVVAGGSDTAFNIVANGNNVTLIANDAASGTAKGNGSITSLPGSASGSDITTNGGSVNLFGAGVTVGNINTSSTVSGAGNVVIGSALQPITKDIVTSSITTASLTAGYGGGSVSLVTQSGNITINGTINTSGAAGYGALGLPFNGSSGGYVTLQRLDVTTLGTVSVSGSIVTSGGDGVVDQTTGQGGAGGSAGYVAIGSTLTSFGSPIIDGSSDVIAAPLIGDIFVGGSIIARGGNGSAGNPNITALPGAPNSGGNGGYGGGVQAFASGKVTVGSVDGGVVDASGGVGGAGSLALSIVLGNGAFNIPGGIGGAGGSGRSVSLEGSTVAVSGSVLANGGAGGYGGDGISLALRGGAGGFGGSGGGVTLIGTTSVSVGAVNATGGTGGNGGAYGGAGGFGGGGGFVTVAALGGTITPLIDVNGGAGGVGGAANGGSAGIGGNGGSGGDAFVLGNTIDMSTSGIIGASGGAGGTGGAGVSVGGNGGNGGSGGEIQLIYGSTFLSSTALNASVNGGTGGAGGAGTTNGLTGAPGAAGAIMIQLLSIDTTVAQNELAANTVIDGTNRWIKTNNAPSIDDLEKKSKDSKQKKEVACK